MGVLFWRVLQMSMTAAVVIVAVLLLRVVMRRAPRIFSYMLWAVVLFRLLCPVSVSSPISLFGLADLPWIQFSQTMPAQTGLPRDTDMGAGNGALLNPQAGDELLSGQEMGTYENGMTNSVKHESGNVTGSEGLNNPDAVPSVLNAQVGARANLGQGSEYGGLSVESKWAKGFHMAGMVWLCGVLGMICYGMVSVFQFLGVLRGGVRDEGSLGIPVFRTKLPTAFVYGIFKPCIYLPEGLLPSEEEYILLHEQIHVKRGDQIWRMLGFAALAIHWFNPLAWVAFVVSGKDMEMSCDEAVIRRLGRGRVKEYSDSLLALATGQHVLRGAPLAFGEGDTGSRIRNVLRYRKPAVVVTVAAALVCVVVIVVLATNPSETMTPDGENPTENVQGDSGENALPDGAGKDELGELADGEGLSGEASGVAESRYDRIPEITLEEKYADVNPELLREWRTLEWRDETFTAEEDGIYRTVNGGTERIFEGYVGILPNLQVYDRRLFFLVDVNCTSKEDFTFYNDIRWIDLDTPRLTGLVQSETMAYWLKYYYENLETMDYMVNFEISDGVSTGGGEGFIETWNDVGDGFHQTLLTISAKGFRIENLDVLSEEERKAYGQSVSDWMRQNLGTVQNVSIRGQEETYAWLDLDGDGELERVSLQPIKEYEYRYSLLDHYLLTVGEQKYEGYGERVTNNLLAFSLDGKEILLAIYEDGPSGDPHTYVYRYDNGRIKLVGEIENDIRYCEIEEGRIQTWERIWHVETDSARFSYELTEDYKLERLMEESYELSGKNPEQRVKLKVELPVYETPDGAFKLNITPGAVFFERIKYGEDDSFWLYVTGYNGSGWFKVEDGMIDGLEQRPDDVFENLSHAG